MKSGGDKENEKDSEQSIITSQTFYAQSFYFFI